MVSDSIRATFSTASRTLNNSSAQPVELTDKGPQEFCNLCIEETTTVAISENLILPTTETIENEHHFTKKTLFSSTEFREDLEAEIEKRNINREKILKDLDDLEKRRLEKKED